MKVGDLLDILKTLPPHEELPVELTGEQYDTFDGEIDTVITVPRPILKVWIKD